jgi:electron transport complex protein RnfC
MRYIPPASVPAKLQVVAACSQATLLVPQPYARKSQMALAVGDRVQTGQKLMPLAGLETYVVSSVTGTVTGIRAYPGDFGRDATAIDITPAEADETVAPIESLSPSLETLKSYLAGAPGNPPLALLDDPEHPIHTVVVCGVDADLLVGTNQYVIKADLHAVAKGIEVLKAALPEVQVAIAVPRDWVSGFGHTGADLLKAVSPEYPAALPKLILHHCFGVTVPAGRTCAQMGYAFFSAEAVASIGKAFATGLIPVTKTLTLIDKSGRRSLFAARLGTPVADALQAAGITLEDRDRVIFGGPMTGTAIYDARQVIRADTDAIMVQSAADVSLVSDYPCVNCGECVRACPAQIQVHMLVRFLEAGLYEDGAERYDLQCCVDCGLCSYVCVARIPVYQYIRLAKHELARLSAEAEASHAE